MIPRRWSTTEDAMLRDLYPTTQAKDIAKRIGRGVHATEKRISRLGITKVPAPERNAAVGLPTGIAGQIANVRTHWMEG